MYDISIESTFMQYALGNVPTAAFPFYNIIINFP